MVNDGFLPREVELNELTFVIELLADVVEIAEVVTIGLLLFVVVVHINEFSVETDPVVLSEDEFGVKFMELRPPFWWEYDWVEVKTGISREEDADWAEEAWWYGW